MFILFVLRLFFCLKVGKSGHWILVCGKKQHSKSHLWTAEKKPQPCLLMAPRHPETSTEEKVELHGEGKNITA